MSVENKYDNVYWRKLRREKEIPLSGGLSNFVGCSYAHVGQWERKNGHPMAEDKIERYIAYIQAYPDAPEEIKEEAIQV